MRFVLVIELGNAEMMTREDIAGALRVLASDLARCTGEPQIGNGAAVRDANGNRVGGWHVEDSNG